MHADHWYTKKQGVQMFHFHNCMQIGYCYEGSGQTLVEDRIDHFEAGTITIVPAKMQHFVLSLSGTVSRWIYLYLDPFGLLPLMDYQQKSQLMNLCFGEQSHPFTLNTHGQSEMLNILQVIIEELDKKKEGYRSIAAMQVHSLLLLLLRSTTGQQKQHLSVMPTKTQVISPVIQYIALHYAENIKVDTMAELCHISATHLRRLFQQIMKCSPMEYLHLVRLEAACQLLFQTELSVLEVGSQVGFSTPTSFTRQFQKHIHTTPGKWRQSTRSAAWK